MLTRSLVLAAGLCCVSMAALAETFTVTYTTPALDRWMYPFNFSAGTEGRASLFGAINQAGFDDRDGQFLVGFDTGEDVPTGNSRGSYKILSATLSVFVENDNSFYYDPSADPLASSFVTSDPAYVADSDFSKPIEVWAAGYRNGESAATFTESSGFGGVPAVAPAQGSRNVFPALLDYAQDATDVSNQARQKLEASPLALARLYGEDANELVPGTLVPQGAEVRFNLANATSTNYVYLQNGLRDGRIRLLVTTLEPTSGGPGGGTGGVSYPRIYTRDNAVAELGYAPRLTLEVAITCDSDFNGDDMVDDSDFSMFALSYDTLLDARCDLNNDTVTDDADFTLFAAAYDALLCD